MKEITRAAGEGRQPEVEGRPTGRLVRGPDMTEENRGAPAHQGRRFCSGRPTMSTSDNPYNGKARRKVSLLYPRIAYSLLINRTSVKPRADSLIFLAEAVEGSLSFVATSLAFLLARGLL